MATVRSVVVALLAAQAMMGVAAAQTQKDAHDTHPTTARDRAMPPSASDPAAKTQSVTPTNFANQAAVISKAEIELGNLAMKLSKDDEVKKFAKRMVADHTASSAKLKTVASKDKLTLPESLDAEHQATKEKLASLEGEAFDREYAKAMAKGHDKAVALFESASQSTQVQGDLKQFAASTLPTLREHREMAHSLHGKE